METIVTDFTIGVCVKFASLFNEYLTYISIIVLSGQRNNFFLLKKYKVVFSFHIGIFWNFGHLIVP